MPVFPPSERVIYQKNSLVEVICQLRFPPILRIEASKPADFQDAVRDAYPIYSEKRSPEFPPDMPAEIARILASDIAGGAETAYEFSTEDETWKLSLTKEFLALTTSQYVRWEDFRGHLEAPMVALREIYHPSFCVRIGLRYRNVINPKLLNLDANWSHLLERHILGELAVDNIGTRIEAAARDLLIEMEEQGKVRLRHGLAIESETKSPIYIIDADYYTTKKTELDDATATLDRFNKESGHLFRWCITKSLHEAMLPQPV